MAKLRWVGFREVLHNLRSCFVLIARFNYKKRKTKFEYRSMIFRDLINWIWTKIVKQDRRSCWKHATSSGKRRSTTAAYTWTLPTKRSIRRIIRFHNLSWIKKWLLLTAELVAPSRSTALFRRRKSFTGGLLLTFLRFCSASRKACMSITIIYKVLASSHVLKH